MAPEQSWIRFWENNPNFFELSYKKDHIKVGGLFSTFYDFFSILRRNCWIDSLALLREDVILKMVELFKRIYKSIRRSTTILEGFIIFS